MPPKGSKQTQEKQLQAALKEEFGITDQEPEKINLGDNAALKRALCDGIIDVSYQVLLSMFFYPTKQLIKTTSLVMVFAGSKWSWIPY